MEENIGESLCDFELDTKFLGTIPKVHSIKEIIIINWIFKTWL